jgi:hypothetical protein
MSAEGQYRTRKFQNAAERREFEAMPAGSPAAETLTESDGLGLIWGRRDPETVALPRIYLSRPGRSLSESFVMFKD